MQSKATKAFASGLADAKRSVESATAQLNVIKTNRKPIGKVLRALEKVTLANDRMYLMVSNNQPYIYISMYNLESFKDDRLANVLGYLSETMDNMKSEDWPQSLNRDYRFTSSTHSVTVSAYVRDDSPTCRKVVVGSELRTVEKYEIVCD
jgi:hypothetical protein